MAAFQFTNFAESTLASGISAVATSATLASTDGGLFPSSGDFQLVIVRNSDGAREIVTATARSSDVLTITREREGTSGLIFVTGDKVELRITAAVLATYIGLETDNTWTGDQTYSGDIMGATPFKFQGSTDNSFRTTLAITDPTGNRTLTMPNTNVDLADIATNAADIATNASDISDNTTDIATNTSAIAALGTGVIVQIVNVQDVGLDTGTGLIAWDDTIPQNTEGDEYTTLAVTPTVSGNRLLIEVVFNFGTTAGHWVTVALFQDSTAGALAAVSQYSGGANQIHQSVFRHEMEAGTTSATTFKVRAGMNSAGTLTLNGISSARKLGGVMASSMRITEITV